MNCVDIVFPLALGPLTYICPDDMLDRALPGTLVSAPVRNRTVKGILLCRNDSPPPGDLKTLTEIHGDVPVLGGNLLRLLEWMSDYYLAKHGVIFKQTLCGELFERGRSRARVKKDGGTPLVFSDVSTEKLDPVIDSISEQNYATYLLHAPSSQYQYSVLPYLLANVRNVIILLPEISQADKLFDSVSALYPERTCIFHSGISKGRRSEYVEGTLSGKYDIVIGTRMALFSPIKKVSLIVVFHEHSVFYKMEDGIRYSARDTAVMRGFFEKATVLLCSITPSADSYYNAVSGKYRLISAGGEGPRPRISVVDMRFTKKASRSLSKTAVNLAGSRLKTGQNVMFVVNRKGYSALICGECENTEACAACGVPMVMRKEGMTLRCNYCGKNREIPLKCGRCGSVRLEHAGSGTERVLEEIGGLLDTKAVRFDRDIIKRDSEIKALLKTIETGGPRLLVGTKMLTAHLGIEHKFSLAVVLDIDASMNFPDFRAVEKAYIELSSILDHVEPEGDLLIQTRLPAHAMLKAFKTGEYRSFILGELTARKSLMFPPYSRMIVITVSGNPEIADRVVRDVKNSDASIEVMGPVSTKDRKRGAETSILLKSTNRQSLNNAVRNALGSYSGRRDVRITLDIDPV
ncbi:MAG: primosomal protein N' [Nitrospirae bacterium]|nr:primosomal protein N' [Nitrospirota bacterium]